MNAYPMHQQPPDEAAWSAPEGQDREPEFNIQEYLYLVWVKRWLVLAVLLLTMVVGLATSMTSTKLYRATTLISVERQPRIIEDRLDLSPNYWAIERYVDEQVRVLTTRRLAKLAAARIGQPADTGSEIGPGVFLGALKAKRVEDTNLVEVSLVSPSPERAAEWLNLYVEEFISMTIEDNLGRTQKVYEIIEGRLKPLRDQLVASEQEMMTFRERDDALLFADQDKNVITEQVNTLTSEYATAKADRIRLETKIAALGELTTEELAQNFPDVLQDPTIAALQVQRNQLQVELGDRLRTLKDGHPEIQELRSTIRGLDDRLTERITTIRSSLATDYRIVQRREQSLYDNIQRLKERSIELSKQTMEYERLKRDYEQNKVFLEDMLARSKEVNISASTEVNNIRVIEPAVAPTSHFTPNVPRSLAVSLVLGLFLGVGLVIGLDFLDQTLRTPEEVERQLGNEVLAVLPKLKPEISKGVIRETFQAMRTALMLSVRHEGCQVLMVTSAVPSEGKTMTVVELGRALTAGGAKVLVIDADLRKPRLHRALGLRRAEGLTSVVLGDSELDDVINTLEEIPRMHLITSGPLPPNPPELFGTPAFKHLIDRARRTYDWVVIDTPPVASVTDPVMCARLVDMILLVVQYGGPRRQMARDTIRQLSRAGTRIAGVLFNFVDLEREHYYYYSSAYYRYGYYYRYRYGENDAEGASGGDTPSTSAT
jgi:capsular exopolysaccharide synthesis family protein